MSAQLPNVGRPKGGAWRRLQDEGIVWEGQVLVTGDETDLAALLIVTNERLAFVRGGNVVLDIERDWLDPAPVLRRTGTVQLWISPPDDPVAESLTFIARDGRDEAAVVLSLITGHGSYGSAYRMPAYAPEYDSPVPDYPVAPSRRHAEFDPYGYAPEPKPLPVFSLLDDDDFPPVVTGETEQGIPAWEEAIAEALEPGTLLPLAGSLRQPNDPIRPLDGFDSKYTRDRRAWVIRLVGLFALVAIGSIVASGLLPNANDIRGLIDDKTTPVVVAQADTPTSTPAETPLSIAESAQTAEPTSTATQAGPSTSDPRNPTVVPIETGIALGVGGDTTHMPAPPTETAAPDVEAAPSATAEPSELAQVAQETETVTAIIPDPDESFTPEPTATTEVAEPTESPAETATDVPTSTSEPETSVDPADSTNAGLRVDLKEVHRGERLPDLTLGRNSIGEWVVILVDVTNETTAPVELSMNTIQLVPNADPQGAVSLDSASSAVASYLGMTPTVRSDESATIPAGGVQQLALVFSIPAGVGDVTLQFGDESFDLTNGASQTADLTDGVQSMSATFAPSSSAAGSSVAAEPTPASFRGGNRFAGWLTGEAPAEAAANPTAEITDAGIW
jgi:hypothetical protein